MSSIPALWLALAAATSTSSAAAPSIELVTLAPGEALYSLWGHTAVRVIERGPTRDLAYNFGSIDFSGDVWAKMLTGHVEARVAVSGYHRMARVYRDENRSIVRRPLNLSPAAARRLADALAARVSGPEPTYRYHHFDDNCATQVADMIDDAVGGRLSSGTSSASPTLRALALAKLRRNAPLYVVVDTLLTSPVDRPIGQWQARFLPEALDTIVDAATATTGAPFAAPPIVDFVGAASADQSTWTWPWVKVYLLFVVPLLAAWLRFRRMAAAIWAAVAGLSGILIGLAWVGTTYDFLAGNYNLLVFPPTHLALLALLTRVRWLQAPGGRAAVRLYGGVHLVALAALVAGRVTGALPQAIDPMLGLALGPAVALVLRAPKAGPS